MPAARSPADAPLFIVLNTGSGSQDAGHTREVIERLLGEAGRRHRVLPVQDGRRLPAVAWQAVQEARMQQGIVVAAGGDGTINAVAQAVLGSGLPFGVLPQGTFNYFSREYGIPADTESAVRLLLNGRLRSVQVGRVNDRIFLVNASLGLYPQVLQDREAFKQQWGRYRFNAVLSALMTVMREHRDWDLELELGDRQVQVRTATLFVGNNRLQLDKLGLPESAVIGEGALAAVMVKPLNRLGLILLALRGAMGRLAEADAAVNFAFRRMTVRPHGRRTRRIAVAIDGEVLRFDAPLTFDVAPRPLQMLLPAEAPAA